jgi:hypothetical protein
LNCEERHALMLVEQELKSSPWLKRVA